MSHVVFNIGIAQIDGDAGLGDRRLIAAIQDRSVTVVPVNKELIVNGVVHRPRGPVSDAHSSPCVGIIRGVAYGDTRLGYSPAIVQRRLVAGPGDEKFTS